MDNVSAQRDGAVRGVAITHVGVTVPDINAAIEWYVDVFGMRLLNGPEDRESTGDSEADGMTAAFGSEFRRGKMAHLTSANSVALELFEFNEPETAKPDDNFRWRETGFHHICVVDPDVGGLCARIVERGGRMRTDIRQIFEGDPYLWVYCEDPWGNVIEVYSHSHEHAYGNRPS